MSGRLAIAGEDIPAGSSVVLAAVGGKVWVTGQHAGEYVGDAVESIREGLRVYIDDNGEVREDDA
jgi:predicted transcriptional regulator